MGLNGAFLTGDLFNLFVFLRNPVDCGVLPRVAGAGQGATARKFTAPCMINVAGSGVFLIAASLLYGVTGTLNMAHLAERVAQVRAEDIALVTEPPVCCCSGYFRSRPRSFPCTSGCPAAYSSAAAPVAALFSIMTKVGVYAIIRVTTLIYGVDAGAVMELTSPWLLPLALMTLALATLGALGAERLATMTAYLMIASIGTILTAVSIGGVAALSAALYYLAHSTLVIALLFLLTDLFGRSRDDMGDRLHPGPHIAARRCSASRFCSVAPPWPASRLRLDFSGNSWCCKPKDATAVAPIWTVIVVTSVLMLAGCARAGSIVLWNVTEPQPREQAHSPRGGEWMALAALAGCSLLLILFAAPVKRYLDETAVQIISSATYVEAVLGPQQDGLVRPHPARGVR